jgi:hypothetical protein
VPVLGLPTSSLFGLDIGNDVRVWISMRLSDSGDIRLSLSMNSA